MPRCSVCTVQGGSSTSAPNESNFDPRSIPGLSEVFPKSTQKNAFAMTTPATTTYVVLCSYTCQTRRKMHRIPHPQKPVSRPCRLLVRSTLPTPGANILRIVNATPQTQPRPHSTHVAIFACAELTSIRYCVQETCSTLHALNARAHPTLPHALCLRSSLRLRRL